VTRRIPAVLFGGLAGIALVATVWFAIEAVLLWTGQQPITWYVRNYISWQPGAVILVVALLAFTLGAAVTHFSWDVRHEPRGLVIRRRRRARRAP
jgi:hypothetical protein